MIGVLGFDSRQGLGIFLFTTTSKTALDPTQPPNQWVQGVDGSDQTKFVVFGLFSETQSKVVELLRPNGQLWALTLFKVCSEVKREFLQV
jgi:hypothetical protein